MPVPLPPLANDSSGKSNAWDPVAGWGGAAGEAGDK